MVESEPVRRSSRRNTVNRPDYNESDSEGFNDDYYNFSQYNESDSDKDGYDESLPPLSQSRSRSTAAARDASLDVHLVDILISAG